MPYRYGNLFVWMLWLECYILSSSCWTEATWYDDLSLSSPILSWTINRPGQVWFELDKSSLLCLFVYEGDSFFWLILALFMNWYFTLCSVSYDKVCSWDTVIRLSLTCWSNSFKIIATLRKHLIWLKSVCSKNSIIPPWSLMVWQRLTIMESSDISTLLFIQFWFK